jgi:hypothetical protein
MPAYAEPTETDAASLAYCGELYFAAETMFDGLTVDVAQGLVLRDYHNRRSFGYHFAALQEVASGYSYDFASEAVLRGFGRHHYPHLAELVRIGCMVMPCDTNRGPMADDFAGCEAFLDRFGYSPAISYAQVRVDYVRQLESE